MKLSIQVEEFLPLKIKLEEALIIATSNGSSAVTASGLRLQNVSASSFGVALVVANGEIQQPGSPEFNDVVAMLPNALTEPELDAIEIFVDSQVACGNWGTKVNNYNDAKINIFYFFALIDDTNARTNWHPIQNRLIINQGATKVNEGYDIDGISQYLDTDNLTLDAVPAAVVDDTIVSGFLYVHRTQGNSKTFFGVNDAVNGYYVEQFDTTAIDYQLNDTTKSTASNIALSSGVWAIKRDGATSLSLIRDETTIDTSTQVSNSTPVFSPYIGARNNQNTATNFLDGILTNFMISDSTLDIPCYVSDLIDLYIGLDIEQSKVLGLFTGLTGPEQTAIRTFIEAEMRAYNWFKMDSFMCFALVTEANALIDWKNGTSATKISATKVSDGFDFDGASNRINTNWNKSQDNNNVQEADISFGVFVRRNDDQTSSTRAICGTNNDIRIEQQGGRLRFRLNTNSALLFTGESFLANNALYVAERTGTNATRAIKDGVTLNTGGQGINTVDNQDTSVGSYGTQNNFDGVLSTWFAACGNNFDHAAHNTNVRQLLTDLGVTGV